MKTLRSGNLMAVFFVVLFLSPLNARADLLNRGTDSLGNQLIYDTDLNVTWYDYTRVWYSWQDETNWVSSLTVNFNGQNISGWRLPTTTDGIISWGFDGTTTGGWNIARSEMGHLFYVELGNKGYYDPAGNYQTGWGLMNKGPFQDLQPYIYWSGTEYSADPSIAWQFNFNDGHQYVATKGGIGNYAIAVLPGDVAVAPVPIPGTLLMLGSGIIGLAGVRNRMKQSMLSLG